MPIVDVARDSEGLRLAMLEMLQETVAGRSGPKPRNLAEGYHTRVNYLLWLRGRLSVPGIVVLADEMEGMYAIAQAESEFNGEWPRCGHCGHRNHKYAQECSGAACVRERLKRKRK